MYQSYYKLSKMPFQTSPNPEFLWLGEKHKEAFAILRYGTQTNYGFLLLTGDVGTGKTTLINALVNELGDEILYAVTPNPNLEVLEFFNLISDSFEFNKKFDCKLDFLSYFRKFLLKSYSCNKKVLLIIDEAHKLSQELFEEIRLLSNIELQSTKLVNIFFVGQNEIHDLLEKEESRALRQRITLIYNMKPFTAVETKEYIKHRLRVAGTEQKLFTEKALRKIHQFSEGYPRLINTLCDRALLTGYAKELARITPSIVRECVAEISLPGEERKGRYQKLKFSKKRTKNTNKGVVVLTSFLLAIILLSGLLVIAAQDGSYFVNLMRSHGKRAERREAVVSRIDPTKSQNPNSQQVPAVSPIARKVEQEPLLESVPQVYKKVLGPSNDPVRGSTEENEASHSIEYTKVVVPFNHDDIELSRESRKALDDLVQLVGQSKEVKIIVKGYTNGLGDSLYNKRLSSFRANMVKSYLIGKGISEQIIASIGMGEENPLKPYGTFEGRTANRRVEVELIPIKK